MCICRMFGYMSHVHSRVLYMKSPSSFALVLGFQEALQFKGFLTISSDGDGNESDDRQRHDSALLANIHTCSANARCVVVCNDGTRLIAHDVEQLMKTDVKHHALQEFMRARCAPFNSSVRVFVKTSDV
jgi:hypothetical protein